VRRICQTTDGGMIASASKDETVIVWNMEKIKQNLNQTLNVDPSDYIISIIDDHEHVIDCIKFAPELACRTI
jgi:WD40 repeat protein